MIARFRFLLPYVFHMRVGDVLHPVPFERDGYRVIVYPPLQAPVRSSEIDVTNPDSLSRLLDNLFPVKQQLIHPTVLLEGKETIEANMLMIDFKKPFFNRDDRQDDPKRYDPPLPTAFAIANTFLARLRSIMRSSTIKAINSDTSPWRVDYLLDDETPAEITNRELNMRGEISHPMSFRGITEMRWEQLKQLDRDYRPPIWETLALDAQSLLPDANAAIVLAAASIEIFINETIDRLAAQSSIPNELWDWLNDRKLRIQNPSTEDKLSIFLKVFTGQSLEDNKHLWEVYQNVRAARNNLAHEGILKIGRTNKKKKTGESKKDNALSLEQASKLVYKASEIIEYLESLLPSEMHRPIPSTPEPITFKPNQPYHTESSIKREIELHPNNYRLYNELATLYVKQERYQEAINSFNRAIELDPQYPHSHNDLGNVYFFQGRFEKAIEEYKRAIELNPKLAAFYNGLGSAHLEQANYDEAICAYQRAMELDTNDNTGYINFALLISRIMDTPENEGILRKALAVTSTGPIVSANIIYILRLRFSGQDLVKLLRKLAEISPYDLNVLFALASTYRLIGDMLTSQEILKEARRFIITNDWYTLARYESILGNADAAISNLGKAVSQEEFDKTWLHRDPDLDWIRNDTRFVEIVGGGAG
jgi:tetratricopeptide (TPR) repeat protein